MRVLLLLALGLFVLPACDTTDPPEEEEEMEEELAPYVVQYVVNAPPDLSDFTIRYTDEQGAEVIQPTQAPFAFPFVEILDPIPSSVQGTYRASIEGFVSEGAVTVQIQVSRLGTTLQQAQGSDQSTGPGDTVSAEAELTFGGPTAP